VKVTQVAVMINDAAGATLESVIAVADANGTEWVYTATTDPAPGFLLPVCVSLFGVWGIKGMKSG